MRIWSLYVDLDNPPLIQHLSSHYQTKDFGKLKYFLGIEVAQFGHGIAKTQRKYSLDILEDGGMLDCKHVANTMDPNTKLIPGQRSLKRS